MSTPLLKLEDVKVHFSIPDGMFGSKTLKAVDGVSFELEAGTTLGVVGESGCGKSTLARAILGIHPPTSGRIWLQGEELTGLTPRQMQPFRETMQVVFQDPLASLNPRMTVGEAIAEPLRVFKPQMSAADRRKKVRQSMELVGLLPNQINRYPHEFSGGQCQRIGIARALVVEPKLLLCDEPVSALDVSIQAQIVNLLMDLQKEMGLSLVFIAHDLAVVRHISDRVMVMYLGKAMELNERDALYAAPQHPYTRALIDAVPIPDPVLESQKNIELLSGELPSPLAPPSGCVFRTRCPKVGNGCDSQVPQLKAAQNGDGLVACNFA